VWSGRSRARAFFYEDMDDNLENLTAEARRRIAEMGYELVDLRRRGSKRRPVMQLRIDRIDSGLGRGITHEDCRLVSRALEGWLDARTVLGEHYVLEVSSPGIERPVRWPEHWNRYRGRDVNVKIAGKGRVRATIVEVTDDGSTVVLRLLRTGNEIAVPLKDARDARLVFDWK
jgi:ribosome maturation factor RimP